MRAGLLTERVVFKEPREERTDVGSVTTVYDEVVRCWAYVRKFSNPTDKDKVDAYERFRGHFGVCQVRIHPKMREGQLLELRGKTYEVVLLIPQSDGTCIVNFESVNI